METTIKPSLEKDGWIVRLPDAVFWREPDRVQDWRLFALGVRLRYRFELEGVGL